MEKINSIKFNNQNVETVLYNEADVDTLIYNYDYHWNKQSDQELMYLIGMTTGGDAYLTNGMLDKHEGLYEGPLATLDRVDKWGISGPVTLVGKTKLESYIKLEKYNDETKQYEELYVDSVLPLAPSSSYIKLSFIENYGYLFYSSTDEWQGGYGEEKWYRLTLNSNQLKASTEYQYGRRVYQFGKIVDENNHWLFENHSTSKVIKHGMGSASGSVIVNYYPPAFESIPSDPILFSHDYTNSILTNITNENISTLSNGMIDSISISQIDVTTFKIDYTLTANSTGEYRDCAIVLAENSTSVDDSSRRPELSLMFIQEPNANGRMYYCFDTTVDWDLSSDEPYEKLFSRGNTRELTHLSSIEMPMKHSIYYALPNDVSHGVTGASF